jgi:hypothetical protein
VLAKPDRSKRGTERTYNYRTDAVRFSHKIAALGAAVETVEDAVEVIVWLDADIVTHAPVTIDWLDGLFPESADFAWLDRARKYPECGFMMFRRPGGFVLVDSVVDAYRHGEIFSMPQTHDSFVIQEIANAAIARGELTVASLSGDAREFGHPCVSGPVGACLDHLKGTRRKDRGKSFQADLMGSRSEPYWKL